ncbi:MAG TPA: hypothetical protein VE870_15210 [Bacteroidales bacterium]|nr:hypothetical protein [Bacteroidales bacterium]
MERIINESDEHRIPLPLPHRQNKCKEPETFLPVFAYQLTGKYTLLSRQIALWGLNINAENRLKQESRFSPARKEDPVADILDEVQVDRYVHLKQTASNNS